MVKNPSANAGDAFSVPGLGKSPGGEHGNPLQCSCLGNPMDRGAWRAPVHRVAKSWTQLKQFSTHTCMGGPHPVFRGPEKNKEQRESLLSLSDCSSQETGLFCLDWGIGPMVLRSPDSDFTTSTPGSPAYRRQIVGLLSLHNPMMPNFICI